MKNFFFALCLAWRQLIFEKGKLIAAVLGITFACVLIFMQLGFRDALFGSVAKMPSSINGDLFIQHQQSEALWRVVPFPRSEMMRAFQVRAGLKPSGKASPVGDIPKRISPGRTMS